jgi:ATP-dependent Clp protease ATP-binding subunit ClpC
MFEGFTEPARDVIALAQEEARALKQSHVGTEHFLLGLLREEESVAARVLDSLGITLEAARAQVGEGEADTSGLIPFTGRAKKLLELSLRARLELPPPPTSETEYIGPEHMLLALTGVPDSTGARVLGELGAPPETVRAAVLSAIEH